MDPPPPPTPTPTPTPTTPTTTPTLSSQPSTPLSLDPSPSPSQPQQQLQQPSSQPPPPSSLPPSEPQPQSQPQLQPEQQPPSTVSSSTLIPIPNSNPNPTNSLPPYTQQPQPNNRGAPYSRPWSQPTSQFSHFSSQFQASASPSTSSSSSTPLPQAQRGGIAIGVPAHHPTPPPVSSQPASSFSSSFGAQYGGAFPRNPVTVPDPSVVSLSSPTPSRPPMHGMSSMGMIGSQIRPGGVVPSSLHQQRPIQTASGIRPQITSNNLPSVPQNFLGHSMMRTSSVAPPSTLTPNTSQSQQSPHQPWLSAPHVRPPLPSQSFRPQQLLPSSQQQQHFPAPNQSQENFGQQLPSSTVSQPLANQQQTVRVQGSANQKPPLPAVGQASILHSVAIDNTNAAEVSEHCSTILSKRNIQELVNQIDPSERLNPEVEDVLVDIAEDFIDSVTTFGCSLAKHRKSNTLEAKDILLHLERTWNMALPGFSGDEIKTYKKPVVNDVHKERLSLIKKSLAGADNKASAAGPATGNIKGHLAKATPSVVGS
ncbi:transcription initiation factor TFIID subunit 12 isoform X2 [Beta vulgaris subsp. vulgaris]|uniref:transcription initiation factor TFIID subunit 12 isoform X2 n=1 Tax=Beta vulgaris subsp. vulgaris TaxID=3555 RepID=UPI00053F7DC8|nr:transcription initiation factor TFIID subunit 12 isoform X2 [Beta vulgaris subsp. vulgaris]